MDKSSVKTLFRKRTPVATSRSPTQRIKAVANADKPQISPEERQQLIAEAAYFIAEKRGFMGGYDDCVNDWLCAEEEIDQKFELSPTH